MQRRFFVAPRHVIVRLSRSHMPLGHVGREHAATEAGAKWHPTEKLAEGSVPYAACVPEVPSGEGRACSVRLL
jgi:hypothetical protein